MTTVRWRKSSRSTSGDNCVELAHTRKGLRDSKNPAAAPLSVTTVDALLSAVKRGRFDR